MLLVLNIVYDNHIPAQVARDLHTSKTWTSDWLKRYREENIEGLKNRTKSGRPPDISPEETVYEIKKELTSSKQGWTTKQVEDLIVTDEPFFFFFFYDSLVRRVWIRRKDERPVGVRITGSHQEESVLFGATSLEGKQLFRQFRWFNANTSFLDYLKQIHRKFPKCYLFLDKAKQHYKSQKVLQYFAENKHSLIPVYLPTASPEFMVLEEIWHL